MVRLSAGQTTSLLQTPIDVTTVAPVQNTWYPALNVKGKVHLDFVSIEHASGANKLIQVRITSNGKTITTAAVDAAQWDNHILRVKAKDPYCDLNTSGDPLTGDFSNLLIEYRTTSAGGANLECFVQYKLLA